MTVEFLEKFSKDLDKIQQKSIQKSLVHLIEKLENATNLSEIPNLKKLKGFKYAYRIRLGDYRVGILIENNIVQFTRIAHRKDIYKIFP